MMIDRRRAGPDVVGANDLSRHKKTACYWVATHRPLSQSIVGQVYHKSADLYTVTA